MHDRYEANWLDLVARGHLAKVKCVEVRCPMAPCFYKQYLNPDKNQSMKSRLYAMNPNKFHACEELIRRHEELGHKVLVFCDQRYALEKYARIMRRPYLFGDTTDGERLAYLDMFRSTTQCNVLFLSSIGDASIDLPDANVIIQINSHYASRRQEAQRLGTSRRKFF